MDPHVTYFKPAGIPLRGMGEVILSVDEFEALRLKDLEGLDQEEAAGKMGISQPTFHRLLQAAHGKVADALVNGKALRIGGGEFVVTGEPPMSGRRHGNGHRRRRGWRGGPDEDTHTD